MSLGQKSSFTGTVRRARVNVGTQNEHDGHVLDTGNGPALELKLNLGSSPHAFTQAAMMLDRMVGMRVKVEGVAGSGVPAIFIDNPADIAVLGPPGRPARPPRP